MEGEPAHWFARFTRDQLLGRARTLRAVWEETGEGTEEERKGTVPNRHFNAQTRRWNWKEGAAVWDIAQFEEDAEEQADRRRALVGNWFAILEKRLPELEPDPPEIDETTGKLKVPKKLSLREFAYAMQVLFRELRIEYAQPPAQRIEPSGAINVTFYKREDGPQ